MNVLVIGSGGREHALCHAFSQSSQVGKLYCANGNAGIAAIAEIVEIGPDDIHALADFAVLNSIDLTFVGGEISLALGIVDEFEARGLKIIGASKAAARLEASKSFAKDFMMRQGIPTAKYRTVESVREAVEVLVAGDFGNENEPVVIKADGLAAGKGVVVAANRGEAIEAINRLEELAGAEAASTIVIEQFLTGKEVSLLLFCDGESFASMPPTRDHKRIGEGDTGPNTGGMGTFTDAGLLSEEQLETVRTTIIEATLAGCRSEGFPLSGVLFLGLMVEADSINVLEYNVRFGDPEAQSILVRLETDLVDICEAIVEQRLGDLEVAWRPGSSACVILAAEGYPAKPRKGDEIRGLSALAAMTDVWVFHGGTRRNEGQQLVTSGGRVLGVASVGDDLETALTVVYTAASEMSWDGMQFRRDIGR